MYAINYNQPADKIERYKKYKSVSFAEGSEGRPVVKDQYVHKSLAVFTSGGNAQGINAAVRAIVRMGIYLGAKVYFILEGYQGMVEGGDNIVIATWASVTGIVGQGGTIIGSSRSAEFTERSGRLKACKNLVQRGINNLICIGGDGSLTGANLLKQEWGSLLEELVEKKEITKEDQIKYGFLNIVGIVGSIDNDFCGTDMTIGADSALHRIIEAVDAIVTTALSHQRCFVMEVMGRHCGYLALVAGLACDADWVLIPENPPEEGWEDKLCDRLKAHRDSGHRLNIIIVAEGARDLNGNKISSFYIKELVMKKLNFDTRVTVLGHVQRGGFVSAFDRCLGIRMGSEAVLALMNAKLESDPLVISIKGNQICLIPLTESIEKINSIYDALNNKDFNTIPDLRGRSFRSNLDNYLEFSKMSPFVNVLNITTSSNFGVIVVGGTACGINSAVRSFVRHSISKQCRVFAMIDGFDGFRNSTFKELAWKSVDGWSCMGGSLLGCQKTGPKEVGFDLIAKQLALFNIKGLLVIGGFEAFKAVLELSEGRKDYAEFRIPIVCLPATISNNVPGTDFSVGCDTALNEIVSTCDKIKQSAVGLKRKVFVIETMGGHCGYLATLAGLAIGADQAYIFEENFTIQDLMNDASFLRFKVKNHQTGGFLLRNEHANDNYTTDFIASLLAEEGKDVFNAHKNVIGHLQQGGVTSPFDRTLAIKLAVESLHFMLDWLDRPMETEFDYASSAVVIGLIKKEIVFTPVGELKEESDFKNRLPKYQWWMKLRALLRIMAHHDSIYISEMAEDEGDEYFPNVQEIMSDLWDRQPIKEEEPTF